VAPSFPGTSSPDNFPRNPMNDYAGSQGDGRVSSVYNSSFGFPAPPNTIPGLFDPLKPNDPGTGAGAADTKAQFILHGGPYGPSGTEAAPNCQAGQFGYPLGQVLIPGQHKDNPSFGPSNVAAATGTQPFGRTDLFLRQDGTREFWDSP
jgi:hypothetical protein